MGVCGPRKGVAPALGIRGRGIERDRRSGQSRMDVVGSGGLGFRSCRRAGGLDVFGKVGSQGGNVREGFPHKTRSASSHELAVENST